VIDGTGFLDRASRATHSRTSNSPFSSIGNARTHACQDVGKAARPRTLFRRTNNLKVALKFLVPFKILGSCHAFRVELVND
jgi:hypothetical protein